MSDPTESNLEHPSTDKSMAYVVYVLYLIGFLVGGAATLVGVVIAYLARIRTSDPLLLSHYSRQIQIFWWSLLAFVIAIAIAGILFFESVASLLGVIFGVVSILVITITVVVLVIRGMLDLSNNRLAA